VQYLWSPAGFLDDPHSSFPIATISGPVVFKVSITDNNGCVGYDSVVVSWKPKSVYEITPKQTTICKNGETHLEVSGGGDRFRWEPAQFVDNPQNSSVIAQPIKNTTFTVIVYNNECKDSTILNSEIAIYPPIQSQIRKSNDLNCENSSVQLLATGGEKFRWEPASSLNNSLIPNPVASPFVTTQYFVFIEDSIGCINKDSITIFFNNSSGNLASYQLPNAFTPNGDGLNDCFGISRWGGGVEIFYFNIYNRWGQQVFSGNSKQICWDGNFKNNSQPGGNYIYKIHVNTPCGEVERKGSFLLIR